MGLVACLLSLQSTCPSAGVGPEASVPRKAEKDKVSEMLHTEGDVVQRRNGCQKIRKQKLSKNKNLKKNFKGLEFGRVGEGVAEEGGVTV